MPYDNFIHIYVICNIRVITLDNEVVLSIDDKVHAMWLRNTYAKQSMEKQFSETNE